MNVADEMVQRYMSTMSKGIEKPRFADKKAVINALSNKQINTTVADQQLRLLNLIEQTRKPKANDNAIKQ